MAPPQVVLPACPCQCPCPQKTMMSLTLPARHKLLFKPGDLHVQRWYICLQIYTEHMQRGSDTY